MQVEPDSPTVADNLAEFSRKRKAATDSFLQEVDADEGDEDDDDDEGDLEEPPKKKSKKGTGKSVRIFIVSSLVDSLRRYLFADSYMLTPEKIRRRPHDPTQLRRVRGLR